MAAFGEAVVFGQLVPLKGVHGNAEKELTIRTFHQLEHTGRILLKEIFYQNDETFMILVSQIGNSYLILSSKFLYHSEIAPDVPLQPDEQSDANNAEVIVEPLWGK